MTTDRSQAVNDLNISDKAVQKAMDTLFHSPLQESVVRAAIMAALPDLTLPLALAIMDNLETDADDKIRVAELTTALTAALQGSPDHIQGPLGIVPVNPDTTRDLIERLANAYVRIHELETRENELQDAIWQHKDDVTKARNRGEAHDADIQLWSHQWPLMSSSYTRSRAKEYSQWLSDDEEFLPSLTTGNFR